MSKGCLSGPVKETSGVGLAIIANIALAPVVSMHYVFFDWCKRYAIMHELPALLPLNSKKSTKKRCTLRIGNYIPLSQARNTPLKLEDANSEMGYNGAM